MTTLIPKFDFKNGGTTPANAINRPINLKLSDSISVKDFGAVGDGTTDDSTAIQAALNMATALGNCEVLFPAGTYYIASTIFVYSNTVLTGENSEILYKDQTSIIRLLNVSNVTIRDLRINANGSAWTAVGLYVLSIMGSNNVTIVNNEIYNGYGAGIVVSQTPGLPLGTNPNYMILIEGNHIHNIGDITGADAWRYGSGIAVTLGNNVIIRNNFIHDIARVAGIDLEGQGMNHILIEGNIIYNTLQVAAGINIYASGSDVTSNDVTIQNNTFYSLSVDSYSGALAAIYVNAGGYALKILNNTILSGNAGGIEIDKAQDVLVSGNTIRFTPNGGIQCANTVDAKIVNNTVEVPNPSTSIYARIRLEMTTDGFGTGIVTGNTIVNAPYEAFNLNSHGAPFVFTGNTIINCRLAGTSGVGIATATGFYNSILGNNTILDTVGSYSTRFVCFYDFSSTANADATINPDAWKLNDTTLVKYAFPTTPLFFQSELALVSAAPTAGYNYQGRILWNKSATVGQPKGWVCTVAGTPGTWVSMGNL